MKRKAIPAKTEKAVLLKSRRRCCLCYWLEGIDKVVPGQIAHLDQDNTNFEESNLAFLCLLHHDQYDGTTSQSKGLAKDEVQDWRDELYLDMRNLYRKDTAEQRRREKFAILEADMGDLLAAMRKCLAEHPLWRYCSIREGLTLLSLKYFVLPPRAIPELRQKMDVLLGMKLVKRQGHSYTMTEELAGYLRSPVKP